MGIQPLRHALCENCIGGFTSGHNTKGPTMQLLAPTAISRRRGGECDRRKVSKVERGFYELEKGLMRSEGCL